MTSKHRFILATAIVAALNLGCSAEQMAQFQRDMQQAQQNANTRQRACATEADRYWNLYSGSATTAPEKSIGGGMYEIRVSAPNHGGVCTVTEAGAVRGVMNDGGGYGGQQGGSSSGGADYDRGCADAKAGSYDRSGHAGQAYEAGWNACRAGGGSSNTSSSTGSDWDRGCADAKAGSYDRSGHASQAYETGWNACRR